MFELAVDLPPVLRDELQQDAWRVDLGVGAVALLALLLSWGEGRPWPWRDPSAFVRAALVVE